MWNEFFAEKEDIVVDDQRTFRIYRTKQPEKPGPVLLLLHGGGYSALTWAHFCVSSSLISCGDYLIDFPYFPVGGNEHDPLPMPQH